MEDNKTNDEVIAEALIQIIENQMKLKKHLGIVNDTAHYGDCYYDHEIICDLRKCKIR